MTIINHFSKLLLEKSVKENRRISIAEVSRETKINQKTLQDWYNGKIARFDAPVIEALCKYFNCEVGDLLVYEPAQK